MEFRLSRAVSRLLGLALLTALIGASVGHAAPIPYGNNPAAGNIVTLNGNPFYYETYGAGVPVLLLHGNGASIGAFDHQIGAFAAHHQVIAMDSRGQGRSELGTSHLTYEQMADDANALLDHLKLRQVQVVGWSDSGIIGLLLAIRHPDKVAMLAILGANVQPDGVYPWAFEGIARQHQRAAAQLSLHRDSKALLRQEQLLALMKDQPHISPADLASIHAPTLVMAGDRDLIRDDHTLSIFHQIPKSQLLIFPGATHLVPVQDPTHFNQAVLDFLDRPFAMPDTKDFGWFN